MNASRENVIEVVSENGVNENNAHLTEDDQNNDRNTSCSISSAGAVPKVKNVLSNIPNMSNGTVDVTKINNNTFQSNFGTFENNSNAATSSNAPVNSSNFYSNRCDGRNGVDLFVTNGMNYNSVERNSSESRDCVNRTGVPTRLQKLANEVVNCMENRLRHQGHPDSNGSSDSLGNRRPEANCDNSSDELNDDDHLSDEFCVYTYKGDQAADLPHSFFRLDMMSQDGDQFCAGVDRRRRNPERNSRNDNGGSSPEMDYLEMDFDPGPSCDNDSDVEDSESAPNHMEITVDLPSACCNNALSPVDTVPSTNHNDGEFTDHSASQACATSTSTSNSGTPIDPSTSYLSMSPNSGYWMAVKINFDPRNAYGIHNNSGNLHTPDEACEETDCGKGNVGRIHIDGRQTPPCTLHSCVAAKRFFLDKHSSVSDNVIEDCSTDGAKALPERIMIWSEQEAYMKQVLQIGTSACGATAVINVLLALNIPFCIDEIKDAVRTRLRADSASLPRYLFSRCAAGSTHEDIIRGLEIGSHRAVYARFFPFFPERNICLTQWLGSWIKKGAIPVITANLQVGLNKSSPVPDAWHHQMVFGIGPCGLYLTNPLERVSEDALWPQITSPPVLLVRRTDVLSRWHPNVDLEPLMVHSDSRWKSMNVLGQVVNMLREAFSSSQGGSVTQYLRIPASYTAGITLAIRRESPAFSELRDAGDLPLIQSKYHHPSEHYH